MSAPPLLQRIRTGLPPALHVAEIAELEHPDDPVARDTLARHIGRAVALGDLAGEQVMRTARVWRAVECAPPARPSALYTPLPIQGRWVNHFHRVFQVSREDYRRWRGQCPSSLLSEMTLIDRWWAPAKQSRNPVGKPPDRKRERQDALSVAIQTAIDALPGPPTLNAVFDYLATNDATKTIIGVSPDGGLVWVGYNGSNGKLYRAALEKRLARKQTR